MATVGKRRLINTSRRRLCVDSDDEMQVDKCPPASASATTTDGLDSDEPYVKRHAKTPKWANRKSKSITTQFLDNFLVDFTPDELAAKRTVEVIYGSSGSFSYTFKSLQESLFSSRGENDLILKFLKALSAVADEYFLLDVLSTGEKVETLSTAPNKSPIVTSTITNYGLLLKGVVRRLESVIKIDLNASGWHKIDSMVKCFLLDGLLPELRSLILSYFDETNAGIDEVLYSLRRVNELAITLDLAYENVDEGMEPAGSGKLNAELCIGLTNRITEFITYLRDARKIIAMAVINRPESEGLESLIKVIEIQLGIKQNLSAVDAVSLHTKVETIRLILSSENSKFFGDSDLSLDSAFIRQKFENICLAFEEQKRKQQEEQAELMKRCKLKRDAIRYILARVSEVENPNTSLGIKHPGYIVGIPPTKCNNETLRKCGRKLKTLLHPDTEHDLEWKERAEHAFKEASLALEKCANYYTSIHTSSLKMPIQPPFAAFIGLTPGSEPSGQPNPESNLSDTDNILTQPTLLLLPVFALNCMDRKVGSLSIVMDPSTFTLSGFSKLGKNKRMIVYLHRPTHGDEPSSFKVDRSCVSEVKRISLPEAVHGKHLTARVDAVQPIIFGNAWRYFVGVQLVGDIGASPVVWKSIYVELATKGRTVAQVGTLLSTFTGASFIDQDILQSHIARCRDGSKVDGESFLQDCARAAQRWADEQ
ncbi:uncharacterized protein BBOV_IV003880 [Babesia bovis T2Bo]|uniref:J domain-containing protein n=1 Tax=Babesia bovis TaxID=5865 RepID=A7AQD0_BABBO|nr:uncharacterized protein BBOV_IV003880 [Babesia bovis T2Bo]EDO06749.1 hypothetical protein BBOV_IV003880 [Babesia bovis T2Bo]|eukprot:XP_001610317.1 hypothetical protein [Babesia bovis T2Bo]